jgi:hypothetical protein
MSSKPDVISIQGLLLNKGIEPDLAVEITQDLADEWDFLSQNIYPLPKLCPEGGEHKWTAECEKCSMKIYHNPDIKESPPDLRRRSKL